MDTETDWEPCWPECISEGCNPDRCIDTEYPSIGWVPDSDDD